MIMIVSFAFEEISFYSGTLNKEAIDIKLVSI